MSAVLARQHAPRLARDQRIDAILDAARSEFCNKGYDAAIVARIAERIGVVEGTIYKYFPSKRSLLLAVLEHWYAQLFGDVESDLESLDTARARMQALIHRHLDAIRREPQLCHLIFTEVRAKPDYPGSVLHKLNRRYTRLLVDEIAAGALSGEFRADLPPSLLRDLVYGGIEHRAWHMISGRGLIDFELISKQIVALLCEGLMPMAGRRLSAVPSLNLGA